MNCTTAKGLIPLLLTDALGPGEREPLEEHLRGCPGCAAERLELRQVLTLVTAAAAPRVEVDLAALFGEATRRQRRQVRRWRLLATFAGAACLALALVAFWLKLDVRRDRDQVVIRWGDPPVAEVPAPPAPPAPVAQGVSEERVHLLSELIQALAADVAGRDERQQQAVAQLQAELRLMQRASDRRWAATERDLAALYTAQFGPKKERE
jgi:hypothetical protein